MKNAHDIENLGHGEADLTTPANRTPANPAPALQTVALGNSQAAATPIKTVQLGVSQVAPPPAMGLRRTWLMDRDSKIIRFITKDAVSDKAHKYIKDPGGGMHNFWCNSAGCCLCLAGCKVEDIYLLPVYLVESREFAVMELPHSVSPGALFGQVNGILGHANYHSLICEWSRQGSRYTIMILQEITPGTAAGYDYGDDAIRDAHARGFLSSDAVGATYARSPNDLLLRDHPWLKERIAFRHPGFILP